MRLTATLLILLAGSGTALADVGPSEADARALAVLTDAKTVGNVIFHWGPEDLDAARVEAAIERHLGYYGEVEKALAVTPPGPVHVFLYRDHEQLRRIHATGAWAFSAGASVHEPHDYDDCHEFVHLFAQHLPTDAESVPPEPFFVDGLATALQREDRGVPISTWVAVAARYGRPVSSLVSLRRTWPQGAPGGVHPYHLAGSFVEFVIGRFGLPKMRHLYTHCLEFQGVLGTSFAALEKEWRAWLSERTVPADHEKVVLAGMGIEAWPEIPADLRKAKGVPLFDGKSLRGFQADVADVWTAEKGVLRGRTDGNWAILRVPAPKGPVRGIRVRFRMLRGTAFQIRMNDAPAGANEAIFAAWTTFFGIEGPERFLGAIAQGDWRFGPGAWQEAVLVNDDGVGRIYVNGLRVIEVASPAVVRHEGGFALGIQAGEVEVASVEAIRGE